ncbi:hypothetical protein HDU92_000201 [Lobulomyces angularis]|nr:hypothetical protein HDU92_000201 [Lobulomyces angularis]
MNVLDKEFLFLNTKASSEDELNKINNIELTNLNLSQIDKAISTYTANLRKINLKNNEFKDSAEIQHLNLNLLLTWLNLSNNKLKSFKPLKNLKKLLVLNLSNNEITQIEEGLNLNVELSALILNDNKICKIENLHGLNNLGTLVLSHNQIDTLNDIPKLPKLLKLSIAHNKIQTLPFSESVKDNTESLKLKLPKLKELRLNDNLIKNLNRPELISPSLEILDLGSNLIENFEDVEICFKELINLHNLNLKNNPICKIEGYKEKILNLLPNLRILDTERFDQKFLERRKKIKEDRDEFMKKEKEREIGREYKKRREEKKMKEELTWQKDMELLEKELLEKEQIKENKKRKNQEVEHTEKLTKKAKKVDQKERKKLKSEVIKSEKTLKLKLNSSLTTSNKKSNINPEELKEFLSNLEEKNNPSLDNNTDQLDDEVDLLKTLKEKAKNLSKNNFKVIEVKKKKGIDVDTAKKNKTELKLDLLLEDDESHSKKGEDGIMDSGLGVGGWD